MLSYLINVDNLNDFLINCFIYNKFILSIMRVFNN